MIIFNEWNRYRDNFVGISSINMYKQYTNDFYCNQNWTFSVETEDMSGYETIDLTFLSNDVINHYISGVTDYNSIYFNDFDGDVNQDFSGFTTVFSYNIDLEGNTYLENVSGDTGTTMYITSGFSFETGITYKVDFEVMSNIVFYFDLYDLSGLTGLTASSAVTAVDTLYRYEFTGFTGNTNLVVNIPQSGITIDYVRVYEDVLNDESISFDYRNRNILNISLDRTITKNITPGKICMVLGLNNDLGRQEFYYIIGNANKSFSRF